MTMLEKIELLMRENDMNKRQISLRGEIPYSTVDGWWKKGFENMRVSTFKTLCAFFGVTMESMAYDDREIAYTKDEQMVFDAEDAELIRNYHRLDERGQRTVLGSLNGALLEVTAQDATERVNSA